MVCVYIRVWEYKVTAGHIDAFLAAYGADGEWARLFRQGRGHVGTELYRGTDVGDHFVTVDRWTDHDAWLQFLDEYRETYDRLDAAMTHLSALQRDLLQGSD